jgi:hypothetical protein
MFSAKQHSENSSLREIIVEHQFVAAALQRLWRAGVVDAEILRSEFDGFGYDLVLSRGSVVRHIQLKSGTSLKTVGISQSLAQKPSGCVVFIQINDDLEMGPFYWFGDSPGSPFLSLEGFKQTKRTTPNAEKTKPLRRNHRDVPPSKFKKLRSLEDLLETLLGEGLGS